MQPAVSMNAEASERFERVLGEAHCTLAAAAPAPHNSSREVDALVDAFVSQSPPEQRLGQASGLLLHAMTLPTTSARLLNAVGHAVHRIGARQGDNVSEALSAMEESGVRGVEEAARLSRLAVVGQAMCSRLTGYLAGVDIEETLTLPGLDRGPPPLPSTLLDCLRNLTRYTHPSNELEAVTRQSFVYRILASAQSESPEEHSERLVRSDLQVETAWQQRVMAKALNLLGYDETLVPPPPRGRVVRQERQSRPRTR